MDELIRLAIERLWITADNHAERYRLASGLSVATVLGPSSTTTAASLPTPYRDSNRVWHDTISTWPASERP